MCGRTVHARKPISAVFLALQCSVPCGYGIQSRTVSCMGPSTPAPLSPLLCLHMPKPITIQGCNMDSCKDVPPTSDVIPAVYTPTPSHRLAPQHRMKNLPSSPTEAVTILQSSTTSSPSPKPSQEAQTLTLHQYSLRAGGSCSFIITVCVLFARCMWTAAPGRIRHSGLERRNWALYSINRSTSR